MIIDLEQVIVEEHNQSIRCNVLLKLISEIIGGEGILVVGTESLSTTYGRF